MKRQLKSRGIEYRRDEAWANAYEQYRREEKEKIVNCKSSNCKRSYVLLHELQVQS